MIPHIYLPIAGVSEPIALLLGMGLTVGLLSGLFGVGGGFLLTPLLIMFGIPPVVSAASDSNQIVATCTSGTFAHWRLGNVDFKMGSCILCGGLIGGTLGVQLVRFLRAVGQANFAIKTSYVIVLGAVGFYMFQESYRNLRPRRLNGAAAVKPVPTWISRLNQTLPLKTSFKKSGVTLSIFLPMAIGAMIGILSAVMGLGGGFIMVPAMVYILRMPMHTAVGTNLFQETFTCINVTFMQSYYNQTVDMTLAMILLIGSVIGAQLGARVSHRLKADQLKILLASLILIVMLRMTFQLLIHPSLILSFKGGL